MRTLTDRLFGGPAVQFPGTPIPKGDDIVHTADENGVVSQVQQARLLGAFRHFYLKVIASLQEITLHTAPDRTVAGD